MGGSSSSEQQNITPKLPESLHQDNMDNKLSTQIQSYHQAQSTSNKKIENYSKLIIPNQTNIQSKDKSNKTNKKKKKQKEKQNVICVQKVKKQQSQENDDNFINSIINSNSKHLMQQNYPEHINGYRQLMKPIVQYSSPLKKGAILPVNLTQNSNQKSRWNRAITDSQVDGKDLRRFDQNSSYVGISEPTTSKFKRKQIQKRLNQLRQLGNTASVHQNGVDEIESQSILSE